MHHESMPINKQIDPIWRVIWLDRIWKGLGLGFIAFYLFSVLFVPAAENVRFDHLLSLCWMLIIAVGIVFYELKLVGYWRQIGERRSMALQDPTPFLACEQPLETAMTLQFPVMIQLGLRQKSTLGSLSILLLICLIIYTGAIFIAVGLERSWSWYLLIFGIFLVATVIAFSFTYVMLLRYCIQIELTEDTITTSYRGQMRSLRWDEARLFGQYPSSFRNKTLLGLAFELSNEHTVVRWSQQLPQRFFLKVQSNQGQETDFNQLVGQVNAYVVQRTGLALLELDNAEQKPTP